MYMCIYIERERERGREREREREGEREREEQYFCPWSVRVAFCAANAMPGGSLEARNAARVDTIGFGTCFSTFMNFFVGINSRPLLFQSSLCCPECWRGT